MIVIDTSALVDALVDDPADEDLLDLLAAEELHAPCLLDFEVASALRGHALAKRLTAGQLGLAVTDFTALQIFRHQMTDLVAALLKLRDTFTAYDAAYVVLAQALGAPLVTADKKMVVARELGVDVQVFAA